MNRNRANAKSNPTGVPESGFPVWAEASVVAVAAVREAARHRAADEAMHPGFWVGQASGSGAEDHG